MFGSVLIERFKIHRKITIHHLYLLQGNVLLYLLCCWWLILPTQYDAQKLKSEGNPCYMGTHLRVLSESYPLNTNMTGFRWFLENLCALNESSLVIERDIIIIIIIGIFIA